MSQSEKVGKAVICQSEVNNRLAGITGILVSFDGTFMQYIEGEKDAVTKLYQKIKKDSRHHSVELQFEGSLQKRLFSEWTMTLKIVDAELFSKISSYRSIDNARSFIDGLEDDHTNLGLKMLRYFFDLKNKLNSLGKT